MFAKMLGNMRKLANPDNLGPFMGMNLFGTPDTVARRLEQLTKLGFNYFLVSAARSEENTSELQSLMRISYAVFCLKKKTLRQPKITTQTNKLLIHHTTNR